MKGMFGMKNWFVKLDGSKVILPSGIVHDWSMHGPNSIDAVNMFNDFNDYGMWCMILGAGFTVFGIATGVVIRKVYSARKKANEEA